MSEQAIDYDRMAEGFDTVLPLMRPVAERLIERTPGLVPGAFVLDVASGTGEPGLTLAERHPGVRLLGIDTSEVFVGIARRKAAQRGLAEADVRYAVMNAERLELDDDSVDVVVSRFGMLSFSDPRAEVREAARVLRPGGTISIATWDVGSANTLTHAAMTALGDLLPALFAGFAERLEQYATPGLRESWLVEGGLHDVTTELFGWQVDFPDEDALWRLVSGPAMLGAVLGQIDDRPPGEPERNETVSFTMATVRAAFGDQVSGHRQPDGSYRIPYACRMLSATA
ncbi:class I SAM-dependent methyltransferase [Actinoplanes sp. NPDC049265]|uniref:class I SAM-dependent methyltransferase n=1 Tax=Actinoplanes sp. NPDC049265 TaxID=3363902 RepID=UPI00371371B6